MFLITSQVTVTTTTTTPPVTVVCSRAVLITVTVTLVPTSVGQTAMDQNDVVLPPQFILGDRMRASVSLTTMLQQHQPQSQMPSQAGTNYIIGPPQVSCLIDLSLPPLHYIIFWCCYDVCFSALRFLYGCYDSPMGAQQLEFETLQCFGSIPLQAHVPLGDGPLPMPGVH